MKTSFDKNIEFIHEFEKKAGFEKTDEKQLIEWMRDELKNFESEKDEQIRNNKLMDVMILCFQLARRKNISLDKEWVLWLKKSEKYIKRPISKR